MARVVLPLEPEDQQDLERLSEETGVPVGALIYMRMKGYRPIPPARAQDMARRAEAPGRAR